MANDSFKLRGVKRLPGGRSRGRSTGSYTAGSGSRSKRSNSSLTKEFMMDMALKDTAVLEWTCFNTM